MKNYVAILVLMLLVAGCSVEECPPNLVADVASEVQSNSRSEEEIFSLAAEAALFFEDDATARSPIQRKVDKAGGIIGIGGNQSRSSNQLMHIVNFEDNQGFAIISDNKLAPAIMAVTENGHFSSEEELDNPGISIFLKDAVSYLNDVGDIDWREPGGEKTVYEDVIWSSYGPTLDVEWEDDNYFSAECPNYVCSMGDIALTTFLYAYKYYGSIELTYKGGGSIIVDWDKFKYHSDAGKLVDGHFRLDDCDAKYPNDSIHLRIAQVVREIGYRSATDYSKDFPTSSVGSFKSALRSFHLYEIDDRDVTKEFAVHNVEQFGVLFMYGKDETRGEHIWLCDGYKEVKRRGRRYITNNKGASWEWDGETEFYTASEYYNHYNWCITAGNGYYLDMTFNPKRCPLNFTLNIGYLMVDPYSYISHI